jgi:hypothetical protein
LGRDEAHERVISRGLAFHHPLHPTPANVEMMCQSAPVLTQNQDNLLKNFFPSKQKASKSTTANQNRADEKSVQNMIDVLKRSKAFHVQASRKLILPGANENVAREKVEPFLNRHRISREIASAVVEQQMLGRSNVARHYDLTFTFGRKNYLTLWIGQYRITV